MERVVDGDLPAWFNWVMSSVRVLTLINSPACGRTARRMCCRSLGCVWIRTIMGRGLPGSLKGGSEITGNNQDISMEVEIPGNMDI